MTTKEINDAETYWIKVAQDEETKDGNHSAIASKLELETDEKGVLRCKGWLIPGNNRLSSLVVRDAHERTLHGGLGLTMAKIRRKWWIEKLRSLVKTVIHKCNTCIRYRAKPLPSPAQAQEFRRTGCRAFETVGLDFAGPISYKGKKKAQGKCYMAL